MAINAVLAVIADGGRTIVVLNREAGQNLFLLYLLILLKPFDGGLVQPLA
jgi:hypothetical protein